MQFLNWKGIRRQRTFLDLMELLAREQVDTADEVRAWLQLDDSRSKAITIRFIGPKTADYLKILVGLPVAAMDRHLDAFLADAGRAKLGYINGQQVVHGAADLMLIERSHLDHSIWRYKSARARSPARRSKRKECQLD